MADEFSVPMTHLAVMAQHECSYFHKARQNPRRRSQDIACDGQKTAYTHNDD